MDQSTISTATFAVTGPGSTVITGSVTYVAANNSAIFAPATNLAPSTTYNATITTGAKDALGNALSSNYVWNFTTGVSADTLRPTVLTTDPVNNAVDVVVNKVIYATFSEAMDPSTVTAPGTITLKTGITAVPGTVSYTSTTATITPLSNLLANTVYTGTITTGAKDLAGNAMASNYVWTFRTAAGFTGPTVISTDPLNLETGVPQNKLISAVFSSVMDPATITAPGTFTLMQGVTVITGSVSYLGLTATFTPGSNLAPNTTYTATISTNAKDLGGNALASNFIWSFTTLTPAGFTITASAGAHGTITPSGFVSVNPGANQTFTIAPTSTAYHIADVLVDGSSIGAVPSFTFTNVSASHTISATFGVGPALVPLLSAGNFAVLAGAAVSNTGVSTHIYGDVGSFPTPTINGLLAGNVTGILYVIADPLVGTAKTDLTAAYNDAQGRSLNAISLPGQIGGLTLAPGLYVNSTTSGISGTGPNGILTLDAGGDANAVWIFKVGSTFITDAGTSIVLAGGAQWQNIYWSVGTSATLGTNSVFYGNILADQAITLTTGARLNGRALTRIAAVTLDSNIIDKR